MRIGRESSEKAVLEELGERLSRYRLNRNQTQESLAEEAGVSERTIIRMEKGRSTQLNNLIRVLRVLDLLQNLDALLPAPPLSPIQQVKLRGKQRERASSSPQGPVSKKPWKWGDEQ